MESEILDHVLQWSWRMRRVDGNIDRTFEYLPMKNGTWSTLPVVVRPRRSMFPEGTTIIVIGKTTGATIVVIATVTIFFLFIGTAVRRMIIIVSTMVLQMKQHGTH